MRWAGATIIANASASDELTGKAAYRRDLVKNQSARTVSAYLYADAAMGESTTDLVYGGHSSDQRKTELFWRKIKLLREKMRSPRLIVKNWQPRGGAWERFLVSGAGK